MCTATVFVGHAKSRPTPGDVVTLWNIIGFPAFFDAAGGLIEEEVAIGPYGSGLAGQIYTNVSHVLLAINPHRQLPHLYGESMMKRLGWPQPEVIVFYSLFKSAFCTMHGHAVFFCAGSFLKMALMRTSCDEGARFEDWVWGRRIW